MSRVYLTNLSDSNKSKSIKVKRPKSKKRASFNPLILILIIVALCGFGIVAGVNYALTNVFGDKLALGRVQRIYFQEGHDKISTDKMISLAGNTAMGLSPILQYGNDVDQNLIQLINKGAYTVAKSDVDMSKYTDFGDYSGIVYDIQSDENYYLFSLCAKCRPMFDAMECATHWVESAGILKGSLNSFSSINVVDDIDDTIHYIYGNTILDLPVKAVDNSPVLMTGNIVLGGLVEDDNICLLCSIDKGGFTTGQDKLDDFCSRIGVVTASEALSSNEVHTVMTSINKDYAGTYHSADSSKNDVVLKEDGSCIYYVPQLRVMVNGKWSIDNGILTMQPVSGAPEKPFSDYVAKSGGYMIPDNLDTWISSEDYNKYYDEYYSELDNYNNSIVQARLVDKDGSVGFYIQEELYTRE